MATEIQLQHIYEIVKSRWAYLVYIWKYDKQLIWDYKLNKSFKSLEAAEKYILKLENLYKDWMSKEERIVQLRKCVSYRSFEKIYKPFWNGKNK